MNKKLIFVVGSPRSGSTLLLSYLCGIPNSKILYETKLLLEGKSLEDIANYLNSINEEIVIEKTPEHSLHLKDIEKLRGLCKRDIYVVYIVRPPVPAILSLIKASKDNPDVFGDIDLLGACEKYEESLVSTYNNLILKSNKANSPIVKIPVYGKNNINETVKIDSYEDEKIIPYSFCITYRELIEDSYRVLSTLLNSLYIEADIKSLIDNRITNIRKYLPRVLMEKHHVNVLRDIEKVEKKRRSNIGKQITEGFSEKYIERTNYIRNYTEHPISKETIYDLVANKKILEVNTNPLVTIIVPLYNKEKYIRETLDSLLYQTYQNLRVVVIDDASTDNSLEVVRKYISLLALKLQDKISIYPLERNVGVSYARNIGLNSIKAQMADIITFCDADDLWDKNLVQRSIDTFIKYPYVDCVYSRVIHKKGEVTERDKSKICNGNVFNDATKFNFLTCGSNLFIRAEVIIKNNIEFNLSLNGCEDWDFLIQLSKIAVFKCTKDYLVTYRRLDNSLSSDKKNQVDMGKTILNKYVEDKKEISRTFTRLFLYYLSLKNFTKENLKDLDYRFILESIVNKCKSIVKSYLP